MKKIFSFLIIAVCAFTLVGCNTKKEKAKQTITEHLIERRDNIFAGSDENFYATFCSGEREDNYALDGTVNELIPFGIITFSKLDNSMLPTDNCTFEITINGEKSNGTLQKSPFDNTYSADIEKNVGDDAEISLKIRTQTNTFEQVLYNQSANFEVSQQQAIALASEQLTENINAMKDVEGKTTEAMIKILKDYSGETNRYFWYIGLVDTNGKTCGILIDCNTGEIVSKKI